MPSIKGILGIQGECRYTPSCSRFMQEKIEEMGLFRGVYLGARRLLTCHPF